MFGAPAIACASRWAERCGWQTTLVGAFRSRAERHFDVQEEIARAMAERLRVTLAGRRRPARRTQNNKHRGLPALSAGPCALESPRHELPRWRSTSSSTRSSSILTTRSRGRASPTRTSCWRICGSSRNPSTSKPLALAAARERPLELDPSSAAGHTALACATLLFENNRDLAGQEFERALELNPHYGQGRCWYALFYLQWARGDFERGHCRSTPGARERPAVCLRHDEPRRLPVHSRPAG